MKQFAITFSVVPKARWSGMFPIDMLRYDGVFPKDESDSAKIERTFERFGQTQTPEEITLVKLIHGQKSWKPEIRRWESRGWVVLGIDGPRERY